MVLLGVYTAVAETPAEVPNPTEVEVVKFHHRELTLKRKRLARYPAEARTTFGSKDPGCRVRVSIDETGRPYEVVPYGCPEVFHAPLVQAYLKWRWKPPLRQPRSRKADREPTKAQIIIRGRFKGVR